MSATPQAISQQMNGQPSPAPAAAPMSTPQPTNGNREQALVQVRMGVKMLEKALPMIGYETEEGKAILDILGKCAKVFGKSEDKSEELMPGELKQIVQALGSGSPGGQRPPGAGQMPQIPMPQIPQ